MAGGRTGASAESAAAAPVVVISYDGVINPVASEFIVDALADARARGAQALVIRLDTPGGLDRTMRDIVKALLAAEIPVIVYVAPTGARAASAGLFITLAAHVAAMAPGTNIGAAHPVALGGGEMDAEMKQKAENDAAAYIRSLAEKRGRNVDWAERAVRASISATEREALELKLIDRIAPDLPALLAGLDGRTVETVSGPVTLHTSGAPIRSIEMGPRLRILRALSDPNVAYVLMLLGIYGLIFELSNPGAILPGVVGGICLILAFYAFQTLPINYAGLLLILLAFILFIAEIKVMSYGLLTVGGIVALVLGSILLVKTDLPFLRLSWWVILPMALATAGFFLLVVGMTWRTLRRPPVSGIVTMIGVIGEARTPIAVGGRGQVFVRGELWQARSSEPIARGDAVAVEALEGLTLVVRKPG